MSVWENPCYAIEPIRHIANRLPFRYGHSLPLFLKEVTGFHFGDCSVRHPDRSGKSAWEYYSSDPERWRKFYTSGNILDDRIVKQQFANTLETTNLRYAGIRAVYWAFRNFRDGSWKAKDILNKEALSSFVDTAFTISGASARLKHDEWQNAGKYFRSSEEGDWLEKEAIADSVRFMWTLRHSKKMRSIAVRSRTVQYKRHRDGIKLVDISAEKDQILPTWRDMVLDRGLDKANERDEDRDLLEAFEEVRELVKQGEAVNKVDAELISVLPYQEMPKKGGRLVVFTFKGGLLFYDRRRHESGVLFEKDFDRLVQMLQSDAKLHMYYSRYTHRDPSLGKLMLNAYNQLMDETTSAMAKCSIDDCNKLCRAFDVIQFFVLATYSDDITDLSARIQKQKLKQEGLDKLVNVKHVFNVVRNPRFGMKETMELLKFNKIFPCPDFCIYSVVDSIADKAINAHRSNPEVTLPNMFGPDGKADIVEFRKYMKRNRIINYHDVHGTLPGSLYDRLDPDLPVELLAYPNIDIKRLKIEHVDYINIKGTFNYIEFDGNEATLIKDKTIAPTCFKDDRRKLQNYSAVERNQLLKFLFSKEFKSQDQVHELFTSGKMFTLYKPWILLALKAEAKKPGSRAFSMASDEPRRMVSEGEFNIAQYVTRQRGSSQGKDTMTLDQRLHEITQTPDPFASTYDIMFSTDLDGFSPKQAKEFKEEAFASWAEVFDHDAFTRSYDLFTKSQLRFERFDVSDSFDMIGNDLEGFHGRMNTAAHLDLMGYAVYKMKQMGLVVGSAAMEALIDDGIMRIKLSKAAGPKNDVAAQVMRTISEIYQFAGLKISWDKTFISQVTAMYLNRVFYDGCEVTPGAKAFMRIGKKLNAAIPTIADEIEGHASTARGAIQSGACSWLSYYCMLVEVFKSYVRWGLNSFKDPELDRLALCSYMPVALGGLGVPSLYQLATNEGFSAVQNGLANVKLICHRFSGYLPLVERMLNAGTREVSEEEILRNPTSVRTKLRCINRRRFANVAKAALLKASTNTLIREVARGAYNNADEAIYETIATTTELSEIQRSLLWNLTTAGIIDSYVAKLQNSATAASVIGHRAAMSILLANKSEARMLLNELATNRLTYRER